MVADVASARPARPDASIGELGRLRAENQQLRAANSELTKGLDQIERAARQLRDRRAGNQLVSLVRATRDRADAYVADRPGRHDHVPTAPPPMAPDRFQTLSDQVKQVRFSDDQVAMVRTAAQTNYFTTAQVVALMKLVGFDETRIEIAVACAPRVVDPDQWFQVEGALAFSSSRDDLRKRVRF